MIINTEYIEWVNYNKDSNILYVNMTKHSFVFDNKKDIAEILLTWETAEIYYNYIQEQINNN